MFTGSFILSSCTSPANKADVAMEQSDDQQNGVIDAIMNRRSIRKYKDTPVEREKLEQIVECGINAPSGMNAQPWQVRVVDNKEYIDSLTNIFIAKNPDAAKQDGFKSRFRMDEPVSSTAVC